MKRIVVGLLAVCLLGSLTVLAEEKAATPDKAVKKDVVLQDITAAGKLAKHAMGFTVTEADGTVVKVMAQKAAKEGEAAVVDLEKFVGKDVKVVGKGRTETNKAGKKVSSIKTVVSVEEVAAPAAPAAEAPAAPAAPVAPAAAPEAK